MTPNTLDSNIQRIHAYFADHPRAMTLVAAADLALPEAQVLRHMPIGKVTELRVDRCTDMLRMLESFGNVHVIVSNGGATIEATGSFGGFSETGDFLNVQSGSLDMHIRHRRIGAAFAVEKPSHMSGVSTISVQFYQSDGAAAFKVFLSFGSKPPNQEQSAVWQRYRDMFRLHDRC